jgi:Endonuclease/Exonuclease/phosphatase family
MAVRRSWRLASIGVLLALGLGPAAVPGSAAGAVGADGSASGVLPPAADRATAVQSQPARLPTELTVLQMNLCNSGMAGCYQGGRSVPEAAAVIAAVRPDAVTLDEICRRDLTVLGAAMRRVFPADSVVWRFQAVRGRNDVISSCVDGDAYGIGIVLRRPPGAAGVVGHGGEYPGQEAQRGERRVWQCLGVIDRDYLCTTHLSAFNRPRALAQCRYLMTRAIPGTQHRLGGYLPTVVGGDLNLPDRGTPNVADCLPPGWRNAGDGGVQHVLATPDRAVVGTRLVGMHFTDHPALVVTLRSTPPAR